ncbi:MAG: thioredoxin-disulfide reductase, partial [Fimbriimonadaceae bacterium]|nr:thioredoxin-disulfide reductase [Fimbriimonadaceae bacterium]
MAEQYAVVIVGSGPAGYTAALYAGRADLKPVLFAGPEPGGQLMITTDVENYPGFPEGVMGPDMMELFRKQAERFGAQIHYQTVTEVDLTNRPFRVKTAEMEVLAETLIISTGASAKWIGVKGETEFGGYGVSACATCDGFFFRGKEVIVVGGGDTAMEEAHYLTRHASKVVVVHRRDTLRASKIMQQRAFDNPKIEFVWNAEVDEIIGETEPHKHVTGVRLKNSQTGETWDRAIDGVFVAIGHHPNSDLFRASLKHDEAGYLHHKADSTHTEIPGVFVCGDVAD